jgi:protein gp37
MAQKFPSMKELYSGPVRLIEKEFEVDYGTGKTIFIDHLNDLFAESVPQGFIQQVADHCNAFSENEYVFQSKNPSRFIMLEPCFPERSIFGTTIETNREIGFSLAPEPRKRASAIRTFRGRKFVTIEPILDFDVDILTSWMDRIRPEFVNIGADSKGSRLPEPSAEKVHALIEALKGCGIEIREKHNLERLTSDPRKE